MMMDLLLPFLPAVPRRLPGMTKTDCQSSHPVKVQLQWLQKIL